MRPSVLVQITLFSEETGEVVKSTVHTYTGSYHWEVTRMFEKIGEEVANAVDPDSGGG